MSWYYLIYQKIIQMKNSILIFLLFAFYNSNSNAQSIFKLEAGQTITINQDRKKMLVDEWIMEDNSTIIIGDDVKDWEINANKASFGNNCKIIGHGKNGSNGRSSNAHGGNGGECKDGGHGGNGKNGTTGTDGKNIVITMGLINVNDLYIDVSGGNGGNGGNGGVGGRASCGRICSGQEGGNGGKGGNAGSGGNSGNITVKYWIAGESGISMGSDQGLRANTKNGKAGISGKGGKGGAGGHGKSCPPFNTIHRGGGPAGHNGANGVNGRNGIEGKILFSVIPTPK